MMKTTFFKFVFCLSITMMGFSPYANAQSFKEAIEKTGESIKLSVYSGVGEMVAISSGLASAGYHGAATTVKALSKNPRALKTAASYRDWGHAFAAVAVAGGLAWFDGANRLNQLNAEGPEVADRSLKAKVSMPVAEAADAAPAGTGNKLK